MITELNYELYQDEGTIRTIDIINIQNKEYRFDRRKMDLETGNYIDGSFGNRYDVDEKTAMARLKEWQALPVKDSYSTHAGTSTVINKYIG